MTTRTMDTVQELAAFLRSRREGLDPDRLGLPSHRRPRRTPGPRREEVAELAGVSTDYVVRLEQGRGLRPSAEVLAALARALRLDPGERDYLFDLAGRRRPGTTGGPAAGAAPSLTRLVGDLSPLPAMLLDHRYDILAWNPEMARLLPGFEAVPPSRRNAMWLCLLHPAMRGFYADREQVLRDGIAHLRAAWGRAPRGPGTVRPHRRIRHAGRGLRPLVVGAGGRRQRTRPEVAAASGRRCDHRRLRSPAAAPGPGTAPAGLPRRGRGEPRVPVPAVRAVTGPRRLTTHGW